MKVTRHFTATTVIVYQNKALLHLHKKLNIWLPVGGHIDSDELPHIAAMREVKEESGLDVSLYNPDKQLELSDANQLIRPMYVLLVDIDQFHKHIDFVYYAGVGSEVVCSQDGETDNLKWFTAEEIKNLKDVPKNVKILSLEAINLL